LLTSSQEAGTDFAPIPCRLDLSLGFDMEREVEGGEALRTDWSRQIVATGV